MITPAPLAPSGKLAVLLPGLGAVATTTIAGVLLARRGLAPPVGSFTQLGRLRWPGAGSAGPGALVRELLPLAPLSALEFGAWDIVEDDALASARHAAVLDEKHLALVSDELARVRPMPGAFAPEFVRRLAGTHVKPRASKAEWVAMLREDVRDFVKRRECERAVAVWTGSTERWTPPGRAHRDVESFEAALRADDPGITNAQLYAWALLCERVPLANGAPNPAVDFPAALELAKANGVAVAGKDFKTGQTLLKTVLAPALRARHLGVRGWFSTNILGNRDGEVLDDRESFRAKELTKKGVLEELLPASEEPALYGELVHKVCIEYYPPRGDAKEGWDNVDLFGWLGYPMQLKVNFLCRDSILAAPLVLDLALLLDLAQRSGEHGVLDWLGFFFKAPMVDGEGAAEHDLFVQRARLERALLRLAGVAGPAAGRERSGE